ncbi:MAG: hypothetical protein KDK33_20485, partial [Leptospiraceae bacterium]|nr:hypothetical protein [Leptospiraceae bacterium]
MKKVRLTAIVIASVLVFVFLIAQIALTGANGGLLEFLRGQSSPSITLEHGPAKATGQPIQVGIEIATGQIIHETAPEYLSFALDTSQIVGGKWWDPAAKGVEVGSGDVHAPIFNFDRPRFANLVRALAPAVLRIGGSEADKVFYDMQASKGDRPEPPAGYKSVLTPEMFDNVTAFVRGIPGLKLQFTLNAGPSARNDNGEWDGTNARTLLAYAKRNGRHVDYWELGNELNLYWFMYGPSKVVSAEQYAKDMEVARQEVLDFFPDAHFSGQGSAFWPILGEPLQFIYGFMEQYLEEVGNRTDIVSWHYY